MLTIVRQSALEAFNRCDFNLVGVGPIVSFTFDDFPQSALQLGGSILKSYGVRGTYYAAMGLMNQVNNLGRQFSAEDLAHCLQDGHELGSHTFDHLSCRSVPYRDFQTNILNGVEAVNQLTGNGLSHQFSYPYGHVTFLAKRWISNNFSSCRGIYPGINDSPIDLNLLKANSLYSHSFDLDVIKHLFEVNERSKGWLIFYTHDVSENPSPFGCKPREFESVVKLAIKRHVPIVTVGQAIKRGMPHPVLNLASSGGAA